MFFNDGYYMVGMHAFWWLFWVLLIVLMLFGIRPRSEDRRERQRETPIDILRRRLANGEINAQEYEELMQVKPPRKPDPAGSREFHETESLREEIEVQ